MRSHAVHFVGLVRDTLAEHREERSGDALLTVTFDSELFGHWWFEGVDWLGHVLRELAAAGPTPMSVAEYLRREPATERIDLVEGSWGKNNDHSTWSNERTGWMWSDLARMAGEIHELRAHRLRGIHCEVSKTGRVSEGDAILVVPRAQLSLRMG